MDDDVEMDDEQEQEHDAVDDTVYDDPDADNDDMDDVDDDEDGDDDEEDDDGDEDDDDDDDDGDDDDDDDDDNEDADDDNDDASVAASGTGARRSTHEDALSAATYLRKVQERRNLFRPSPACVDTTLGYQIEPMAAAPHSSHVHAMALSLDGQTLLTGGSDGFVRKYDVHATMNGKTMLTQNVRHGFVEGITRGGTLSAFWPHEEHPPTNGIASSSFPSASVAEKDRLVGVVHSLALQQDALWGVSGSESGNIHLYTLRHDPGVARHVFRKHKGAVSALALTEDETGMISGGWDRGVHQWDLNTGQIVRSFPGHAGQISGLSFRPHAPASARSPSPRQLNVSIHPSAAESSTEKQPQDADDAGDAQRHAEQVKEAPGDAPTGQDADEQEAKSRPGEAESKAAADSAQGDAGADADAASKSVTADAPAPEASAQDITTSAGDAPPQSAEASTPTTRPEPASDAAATDSAAKSASHGPSEATRIKTEPDPSAPSSSLGGGAADDPTEEELAFEAELNASLGMALDGSGGPRADGTRPDRVTLGANGTTAGGLMVAGADEDLDDDAGDDDLFGGSTPPVSAAKDARESARNGRDESDGDDSLFGDGDEDADGDADADADMDAEADADADEDGDDADGSSDEDMPLAGRAMVKNASSQSTLVAESESVPLSLPSSTVKDVKVSSPTAAVPDAGPKKTLPQPAFGGFSVSSSYSAPISSFSPSVMLSTSLSGQAILWDLRCPSYVTDGEARGVHSLGLPSKVPPWCQSAVFSSDGGSVFVGRRNECVDHWDLRSPKLVNTLRLPSGSGPVYALAAMPNSRHIVCGSYDNVRLWDTADTAQGKVPFKIVAGHHGANLSSVLVDSSCKFLLTASGDRGWMGTSTEAVIIHDIKPL